MVVRQQYGLVDIANSPAKGAIEHAVANRLVDSLPNGRSRPGEGLTRSELATYLAMGNNLRQSLPLNGVTNLGDVPASASYRGASEAAVARGGSLRDLTQQQNGLMTLASSGFKPGQLVTRLDLAYSLVQSLAQQDNAVGYSGAVTVPYNGQNVTIEDQAAIPAHLRGYVQLALNLDLINARFAVTQGPFDLQPVIRAYFDPASTVRPEYFAVAAGRFSDRFGNN